MNLRFVEAFYWVSSLKSVSRAAEKLHLTQSAMSARIAALEQELGVLLLDRRDKQFRLTSAGMRFLVYAERFLALQRDVKAELGAGAPLQVSLRIGAIESVLHSWLIPWVQKMQAEHPLLELELTVETTPILLEHIHRSALDMIFAALPGSADGVISHTLPAMEMVFVGSRALHKKARYTLADLAEFDVLTFQRGSQPNVSLLDLFKRHRITPRRLHAISSISAMVQLVQGGFGVATLPRAAVDRIARQADVHRLRCDTPLVPLPIHVSYRADPASSAVTTVVESALAFVRAQQLPNKTVAKKRTRRT
jgi:DNA-binding transcriptional LysR family regulator